MVNTNCPSCGEQIILGMNPKMGYRLRCPGCKAEVEVVWLDPVELDWPYDEDDDEADEYDEWDYEEESS